MLKIRLSVEFTLIQVYNFEELKLYVEGLARMVILNLSD